MIDEDPAVSWLIRELRKHQRSRPKRFQITDVARYAHTLYDTNTSSHDTGHLACAQGCDLCCCAQVGVETAEALLMVRHIRTSRPSEEADEIFQHVKDMANKIDGMDPEHRWEAQLPCVFLHPERRDCTVYEVRPLACRGYNSTSLPDCRLSTENRDHAHPIPADSELMVRAMQLRHGVAAVTARTAEDDSVAQEYELHAGLVWALGFADELAWLRSVKRSKRK